jgi:hypothetical protein
MTNFFGLTNPRGRLYMAFRVQGQTQNFPLSYSSGYMMALDELQISWPFVFAQKFSSNNIVSRVR